MKNRLKPGAVFAIHQGHHKGKFAVCIETDRKLFRFLFLPGLEPYNVPIKDVKNGLSTKILDFVENLPEDVFQICEAQYAKNNK